MSLRRGCYLCVFYVIFALHFLHFLHFLFLGLTGSDYEFLFIIFFALSVLSVLSVCPNSLIFIFSTSSVFLPYYYLLFTLLLPVQNFSSAIFYLCVFMLLFLLYCSYVLVAPSRSVWSPRPPSLFLTTRVRLTFRFSKPKVNWLLHPVMVLFYIAFLHVSACSFSIQACSFNHTDIHKKARHEISLMSGKIEICVRRLFLETRYKFFGALARIPNICNLYTFF